MNRCGNGISIATWVTALAACTLLVGCSPTARDDGRAERVAASTSGVIVCRTFSYLDEDGQKRLDREFYVLTAINQELRNHRDFARAIDMDAITDCEGARDFMQRRADYVRTHPDFGVGEPLDPAPLSPPPRPDGVHSVLEVPKLLTGTPGKNMPVVRLEHIPRAGTPDDAGTLNGGKFACTGVFIAKDWIATAAHCMATIFHPTAPGSPPPLPTNPELNGWYEWQVIFGDDMGRPIPTSTLPSLRTWALQMPDPRFLGTDPTNLEPLRSDHDFALLHLDSTEDDRFLPRDPSQGSTVLVSSVAADPRLPMFVWGFGLPVDSSTGTVLLKSATSFPFELFPQSIQAAVTGSGPEAIVCLGDSGGPAVQFGLLGGQQAQFLVGSLSGYRRLDADAAPTICAGIGDLIRWARVDVDIDWIEKSMRFWNGPGFSCKSLAGGIDGVGGLRCYGSPCKKDSQCATGEYCSKSGDALTPPCPTCGTDPFQACDCVLGQCLPR